MKFLTQLSEQADKVCAELLAAKRAAKEAVAARDPLKAAYNEGRAEELEKWLDSLEAMIGKIIDKDERA